VEGQKDGLFIEGKVRMVGVNRWAVHARVDPTWANPGTPHRYLLRCALPFPARRLQVQPVYLLPLGSRARSAAGGNARDETYRHHHLFTPFSSCLRDMAGLENGDGLLYT
jgi:hypothetical protein